MADILIVHDSIEVIKFLTNLLKTDEYFHIEALSDFKIGMEQIEKCKFSVVITDCSSNDSNKYIILDSVVDHYHETKCIIFAKNPSVKDSVQAIRRGAFDYISQSLNHEEIKSAIKKAAEASESSRQYNCHQSSEKSEFLELIGESKEILDVFKTIRKVSKTDSTILITGESGTGKELIAKAIHHSSDRCNNPMVVINCGAIPGELLESELFGHEKGAFTGAHRTRIGRFEIADGGTIFLDEIGDMSPNLQVKLLRVLQEQSFERVGSTKTIKVNNRIIAATNKDLISSIEEGIFREDLYYRLNVIPIKVPPLRDRKSDIPQLINYFLNRLGDRRKSDSKRLITFSNEAMEALKQYDWPGNIRELENMIERLSVLVDDNIIKIEDLPEKVRDRPFKSSNKLNLTLIGNGIGFNDAVEQYQKDLILSALHKSKGVKAKAAELLKINRTTLVEKMKKMRLEIPKEESSSEEII